MWLMTKHGLYSIVQKKAGEYHVRAREHRDLDNLVNRVPLPGTVIINTPEADYACRIVTDKGTVQAILEFLGASLDYDNFKSKIDATPDQRHKPYHQVWQVLANALGAYGRKGNGRE
jgi:hypothetical protein